MPLRAHGEFHGVVEVFHRTTPTRDAEWTADLEAFGDQIAIAIDQAATASALRDTNRQLVEAYDTTIEGWAAALDLRDALDIPYGHHERWDGTGYPRGLAGDAIPLAAQIFAVVDVYDALSSDRPYRSAWPRDRVLGHLRAESGRHLDPAVAGAFLELIEA